MYFFDFKKILKAVLIFTKSLTHFPQTLLQLHPTYVRFRQLNAILTLICCISIRKNVKIIISDSETVYLFIHKQLPRMNKGVQ